MGPEFQPVFIVLKPGDRVLITMKDDPDPDDAQQYMATLNRRFPGVEFVLFGNVTGVMVQASPA